MRKSANWIKPQLLGSVGLCRAAIEIQVQILSSSRNALGEKEDYMPNKRYQCRTHQGGIFSMLARRGRPPVRCSTEFPCDRAAKQALAGIEGTPKMPAKPVESKSEPRSQANDSLPLAMKAKAFLEPLGWVVKGKAWVDSTSATVGPAEHWAEITCSRGAETLVIRWRDGVLEDQIYSLESLKQSENGIPPHKLNFDPDDMTDGELVRMIRGCKVTWWNSLASNPETAIISPNNISVEHIFVGGGDTDNSKRIIKFLDHGGGGFRAFHVAALLKVG